MMQAIELVATEDRYVISIDKKLIDRAILLLFMQRLWLEHLALLVDFDESLIEWGEEIKSNWWAKNQARILTRLQT